MRTEDHLLGRKFNYLYIIISHKILAKSGVHQKKKKINEGDIFIYALKAILPFDM